MASPASNNSPTAGTTSPQKIPFTIKVLATEMLPLIVGDIRFELSPPPAHPYENPKFITPEDNATGIAIRKGAEYIRKSNIPIAFPTETVYGLGADATRDEPVRNIFAVKDRWTDNPLIVHCGSLEQVRRLLQSDDTCNAITNGNGAGDKKLNDIPAVYKPLVDEFWPGPLTIILPLPLNNRLSGYVYGKQTTIGVRIPSHPVALALALTANVPIAAPSANKSGFPSPTTAQHVAEDLQKRVELVLDGGPCSVGLESTVVDGLSNPPAILRPGGVSLEEIRACGGVWASVVVHKDIDGGPDADTVNGVASPAPRAPGMKYKHYSPSCGVKLYMPGAAPPTIRDLIQSAYRSENAKVGILRTRVWPEGLGATVTTEEHKVTIVEKSLGVKGEEISRNLFRCLREMDDVGVVTVHIEGIGEDDEGLAVMNRLKKAASVIQSAPHM